MKSDGSLAAHLSAVEAALAEAAFTGQGKYVQLVQLIGLNFEENLFVRLVQREQSLDNFGILHGFFERLLFRRFGLFLFGRVGLFSPVRVLRKKLESPGKADTEQSPARRSISS